MSMLVSWEYYSSLYDNVKEEDFPKAELKAEQVVRSEIGFCRWSQINEDTFGYVALQDCICNTINEMAENEKSGIGRGISSVSNDGYSESFAISDPDVLKTQLSKKIRTWLSGTGLIGAY